MRRWIFLLILFVAPLAAESLQEVVVSPGDTMWSIANKYLKDPQKWPEIVKVNNLPTADPTLALPGSRIKIPITLIKEEYRTAQLIKVVPPVKYKRKEDSDFKEATTDLTLRYEDSLRTMKGAEARVKFPSKEVILINENSYVVLKPEKILQEVELLQGDIRASKAKVIMPGGTVVKPRGDSQYQARVKEDESQVVFVYKGEVNVTAQGKTVKVKEGFGTSVPKSAPPIEPMPLSNFKDFNPKDMPEGFAQKMINQPSDKPIKFKPPEFKAKDESPIGKSKSVVSKDILVGYHMQVAKDERFKQVLIEKTEPTGTSFDIKKQSIPDGRYYVRVAFTDALGVQGPFGVPNVIVKDTKPPQLTVMMPSEGQQFQGNNNTCDVNGNVLDAVSISVNGDVVFIGANGRFTGTAYLKEGANTVLVIARDANGNETRMERRVSYKK